MEGRVRRQGEGGVRQWAANDLNGDERAKSGNKSESARKTGSKRREVIKKSVPTTVIATDRTTHIQARAKPASLHTAGSQVAVRMLC